MQNFRHAKVIPVSTTFGFVVDGRWQEGGKNHERLRSIVLGVVPAYCGESGMMFSFDLLQPAMKERTVEFCDPLAKRPQFVLDAPVGEEDLVPSVVVEALRLYRAPFVGNVSFGLFSDHFERRPLLNFNKEPTNKEILKTLAVDSSFKLVSIPKPKVVREKPKPKLVYTPLGFRFK